jgi:hypothetical protein
LLFPDGFANSQYLYPTLLTPLSPMQNIPQLPVELLVIIAEHLIGMFAFGTTANLNVSCHSVYTETLPVLYETFFMAEAAPMPYYRIMTELPKGFQYIKCVGTPVWTVCDVTDFFSII